MSANLQLADCPREELPDSMTQQDCLILWKDITRIVFQNDTADAVNPWLAAVPSGPEDLKTEIETLLAWTDAIAETEDDKITLTPRISNAELTPGEAEIAEFENQDVAFSGDFSNNILVCTLRGLDSDNELALNNIQGTGLKIMIIFKDGKTLGNQIDLAGENDQDLFFPTQLVTVTDRGTTTGSEADANMLTIHFLKGAMLNWEIFDTEAFALTDI